MRFQPVKRKVWQNSTRTCWLVTMFENKQSVDYCYRQKKLLIIVEARAGFENHIVHIHAEFASFIKP